MRPSTTFVHHVTVLAGPDVEPVEDTSLTFAGGVVVDTGAAAPPSGAEAIDGRGLLLMPGFVDAHVHIAFADPAAVVRGGVTTVRDLGWPEDEAFGLASRSRAGSFDGPAIAAVGPILTARGGYPTRAAWAPPGTGRVVETPEEAERFVRHLAGRGAAAIKVALNPPVGPVLGREALAAIVSAAHAQGLKVTGHVHGVAELEKAIDCGMDELAHMLMSEEELDEALVGRMLAADMTIVPTLSIRFGSDREVAIANLARWRGAGGRVVYGTDLGNEGPRPGIDPLEVGAMAAAGYSPREIVRSATSGAATHLGLERKGVLAPGMDADVVAVPLGALEDAALLCDVRMVWREGRRVA